MGRCRIRGGRRLSVCAVGDVGSGEDDGDARVENSGGVLSAFCRDVNVDWCALAVDIDGDGVGTSDGVSTTGEGSFGLRW